MSDEPSPYAEIMQTGRWTYLVSIHHDMMTWGPDGYGWLVLGRHRAERAAQRHLAEYVRGLDRKRETTRHYWTGGQAHVD